ncbi:sigma-54 interaction domain-containing protein [Desulforhopalus singaporensis]|uniref:Arginine utilization regulatory protein n=1 Tax=Desulforhopalus singaporensis TaxID=91360 RepID=A0A1H0U248_9BACT|nr:sigma 54-interacting transcriptional regulator [Desulforhopalus singaporensis]SDP60269.1 arginine utilization regulatory protein [Desulforhopalus singaporensis]
MEGTKFYDSGDFERFDYSTIFAGFHEGVLITDRFGVIVFYNDLMGKIDDIDKDYALGRYVYELYDLTEEQSLSMICLQQKRPILNKPMFYRTHLGRAINAINNVYPVFDGGELVGAICFTKEYQMTQEIFSTALPKGIDSRARKNGTRFSFADIIGAGTDLSESVRIAQMAAESPSSVLIVGETGTGKELFAQSIHNFSSVRNNPFVPINCSAIPENLLEGILFGTSKGAFTGAIEKAGLFEQANGGTLFLDELNSMPLSLQSKLLRVLQEKKVRRIGAHREVELDLKIISSVNKDPHEEIQNGRLRRDLYYRLGVVFIQLPPLRERNQDFLRLVYHFVEKFNTRLRKNVSGVSAEVQEFFGKYHWPGNVRELEHVIEGAMNLVGRDKVIEKNHLPHHLVRLSGNMDGAPGGLDTAVEGQPQGPDGLAKGRAWTDMAANQLSLAKLDELHRDAEKVIIHRALTLSHGNIARAVKILDLSSPQALQYKMKKLNLQRADFIQQNKQQR